MIIERVVIFHGYLATPADHWFGWLKTTLEPAGVRVAIPELPDSGAPDLERWVSTAVREIGTPDERTAVVAHSLGTVTALRALDRIDGDWTLGALIAVAGFTDPLPVLPEIDSFTTESPDIKRTASRVLDRLVLRSDNDVVVPPAHTQALGEALRADSVVVPGAGHFLADEGVVTLPLVANRLLGRSGS